MMDAGAVSDAESSDAQSGTEREAEFVRLFAERLRILRTRAGEPSFRAMAGASGAISHTTLHDAVRGVRLPSWPTVREFIRACGGEEAEWQAAWQEAYDLGASGQPRPERFARRPPAIEGRDQLQDSGSAQSAVPLPPEQSAVDVVPPVPAGSVAARWARLGRRARVGRFGGVRRVGLGAALLCAAGGISAAFALGSTPGHETGPHVGSGLPSDVAAASLGAATATGSGPLVPGDASAFVADVTIPDGTTVGTGQRFVKTWEIANTGTVAWHGRFLLRAHLPRDNGRCATPTQVPVPDTPPGHDVDISVPAMASDTPGSCWVGWKMVDGEGRFCFAGLRPVYFLVTVVDQAPGSGAPGAGAETPAPPA
jgi:hypothetical protein